jgi:hypothetical protein
MNQPLSIRRRHILGLALAVACASLACVKTRAPSIATNTPAPAFSLPDSAGKNVTLSQLTTNGPAVIVFYRGYW